MGFGDTEHNMNILTGRLDAEIGWAMLNIVNNRQEIGRFAPDPLRSNRLWPVGRLAV